MDTDDLQQAIKELSHTNVRVLIRVTGIVQGVGFRPFVFRLADDLGLSGSVCNKGGAVEVELRAPASGITSFIERLQSEIPSVARIDKIEVISLDKISKADLPGQFEIVASEALKGGKIEIPPDIAICEDCLFELLDKNDRRYRYPFLNCTNCGPRFTVIKGFPYDRVSTSMACFPMCATCNQEYSNPKDRRFHAQPNCCRQCGPKLAFYDSRIHSLDQKLLFSNDDDDDESPLSEAKAALLDGQILAIKGLGGFHLVCDATNNGAVTQLRQRKKREAKPFAIMVSSEQSLMELCHVSAVESRILHSSSRPIVLLKKRADLNTVSEEVAPQIDTLGVMLPYTPLQHLLMRDIDRPLVMTSANLSEEPIVSGNREAVQRLSAIADAFLFHNRDITSRYDDSVTRVINNQEMVVRRARSYAPRAIELRFRATIPVLAMGGHLKNTFCLIKENKAYLSQHIGDLDMLETQQHFETTLRNYIELFEIKPELLAIDLHPDYGSTKLAKSWFSDKNLAPFDMEQIQDTITVQHHHAHIASCMAEHKLNGSVIGVALDGIGYGADHSMWGGEFLLCDFSSFERLARFKPVGMPGGVNAIKQPWRMALSYLSLCSEKLKSSRATENILNRFRDKFGNTMVSNVYSKLATSTLSMQTSSCGRLFDAVSALLGLCEVAHYEGHAAVILEDCAGRSNIDKNIEAYSVRLEVSDIEGRELIEIDTTSIIEAIINNIEDGAASSEIAAKFHETIAELILETCSILRKKSGINVVCLSGGVFQNARLSVRTNQLLRANEFEVFTNQLVPANDGGLSLGQAAIALAKAGMMECSS